MHSNIAMKQILIVEDYREAAETFKELLEILGHQVQCAMTGAEAEERIVQGKFDLIFMDLNLPDISGIELVGRLKQKLGDDSETKFAAVSGFSSSDSQGTRAREQFDFYLEKPIDLVSLDRLLASI